uniref:Uncharacterized protein n=1 Tax=Rhizophagus irregularis (strain DAOM 181602 / DAOM 197198 / MUCL 43194) TaxID=747089 RepID=U9UC54_RHIID
MKLAKENEQKKKQKKRYTTPAFYEELQGTKNLKEGLTVLKLKDTLFDSLHSLKKSSSLRFCLFKKETTTFAKKPRRKEHILAKKNKK